MEVHDIIQKLLRKEIDIKVAASQCARSERQTYRLCAKVREKGLKALMHGNVGKRSGNALPEKEKKRIRMIVGKEYADFGPTLAAEKLRDVHGADVSKETLRTLMTGWGLWKPKSRKGNGEHREWRERRALFGELEQFDGCYHAWFEDRADSCCLLASIDDATGRITRLLFVEWEGVFPSFRFWRSYVEKLGKPCAIYLDRHSTYKVNAKTLLDDPEARSQFERACRELSIEVIHAYSPEGKGRIERLFKTLQDRLVKELRLAGISDREQANRWMAEVFTPAFNEKFAVVPREAGDAHRALSEQNRIDLARVFSSRSTRIVANDFTIMYKKKYLQLEKTAVRLVRRRERVEIEEREDGSLRVYLRGAYLPFRELPERPAKARSEKSPLLLAHVSAPNKPAADHPWRCPFPLSSRKTELAH